jgi:S1-C subfamily serine protease
VSCVGSLSCSRGIDATLLVPKPNVLTPFVSVDHGTGRSSAFEERASPKTKNRRLWHVECAQAGLSFLLALVWVSLATGQTPSSSSDLTTAVIAERVIPATATIVSFDRNHDTLSLGSAFFVRPGGILITNWHVISHAYSAVVVYGDGRNESVLFVAADKAADVAVLKVGGQGHVTIPLSREVPQVGSKVVVVGSPLGLSTTVSEGIVSARRSIEGRDFVQVTAAISHGSSGAPILNPQGAAFAIATASIEAGQALNFGVPVGYADALLASTAAPRPLADVTEWRSNNPSKATRPTPGSAPKGATAQCRDGTYSFSQSRRGTCSSHGGVARWL